ILTTLILSFILGLIFYFFFFFSSRRRHTRCLSDWSSDVCSSDLPQRDRPLIGAWCFADHYGPDEVTDRGGMALGPHPHTGLQTEIGRASCRKECRARGWRKEEKEREKERGDISKNEQE